jgi:uridine kinase
VREIRHRRGRDSARGYYDDAFDFESLRRLTLDPLGPGGSLMYAARLHDLETDELAPRFAEAPADAIVVFDETFLQPDARASVVIDNTDPQRPALVTSA